MNPRAPKRLTRQQRARIGEIERHHRLTRMEITGGMRHCDYGSRGFEDVEFLLGLFGVSTVSEEARELRAALRYNLQPRSE